MIKISIIIVNYKSWNVLEKCLNSIVSIENTNISKEVIVVDNFSNSNKLDKFRVLFPAFNFIENKGNYGFSNANNLGAKHSKGDYLLFINPDTIISNDSILSLVNYSFKNTKCAIVSLQQVNLEGRNENPYNIFPSVWTINGTINFFYNIISKRKLDVDCKRNEVIFPDWVSGSVILIRRDVFDMIGGWDEDFWLYSEDVDLCKRTRNLDREIALICNSRVVHQHGGATRKTIPLTALCKAHVIISKHIYFRKHFSGAHQLFLQIFLTINTLIFDRLFPAIFGLVFYKFGSSRKYLFIYFHLIKYYYNSLKNKSWLIDTKNIIVPDSN